MEAVASGGVEVLNEDIVTAFDVADSDLAAVATRELAELARRERAYRGDTPRVELANRTVISWTTDWPPGPR